MEKQQTTEPSTRRGFFAGIAAVVLGGIAGLVPVLSGLAVFLDPLRRQAEAGGFYRVTTLNAVPEDGLPRRFAIVADQVNVWNRYRNVPVGAIYLRRTGDGRVHALNVICPHLGCSVDFKATHKTFLCPCHDSKFNLDGTRADLSSPSKRSMDSLEVEIRNHEEIWVRYQNFETSNAEKIPVS